MFLLKLQSTSQAQMLAVMLPFRQVALGSPAVMDMLELVFAVPPGQRTHCGYPYRLLSTEAVLV